MVTDETEMSLAQEEPEKSESKHLVSPNRRQIRRPKAAGIRQGRHVSRARLATRSS